MRRRLGVIVAVLAAIASLVVIGSVAVATPAKSLVGTWSGYLIPSRGSHASRLRFTMVVDRGERAGTWRVNAHCAGTLRLKDISNGYHHYYRVAGAHARCVALGVDCFERDGAHMVDVFVSNSGTANTAGQFRRVG